MDFNSPLEVFKDLSGRNEEENLSMRWKIQRCIIMWLQNAGVSKLSRKADYNSFVSEPSNS